MEPFSTVPATALESEVDGVLVPGTIDVSAKADLEASLISQHSDTVREKCSTDHLMQMFSPNGIDPGTSKPQSPRRSDLLEVHPVTPDQLPNCIDPHHGLRNRSSVVSMPGNVTEMYNLLNRLGEGGFGFVTRVEDKQAGKQFALKTIPRRHIDDVALFEREMEVARLLKHPYIVRLHQIFRSDDDIHLVMELCTGPDLNKLVLSSVQTTRGAGCSRGLEPPLVARYLWQMLSGLAYLHSYQMAHRDIKPANYMLLFKSARSPLRLVDFGLACCFTNGKMWSSVGSCHYAAPEVFLSEDGYTEKCDIWSLGVTVCVLVTATYPFNGVNHKDILQRSNEAKYSFQSERWAHHSPLIKDLVAKLLSRDPEKRPSARETMESNKWLRKFTEEQRTCCVLH